KPFAFSFTVAHQEPIPYVAQRAAPHRPGEVVHYHSRHDLVPPTIVVTAAAAGGSAHARAAARADSELVFATPYEGPGPPGPLIFDEAGNVVWFAPLPRNLSAANLQVEQYDGQPVLTYWRGRIPPQGFGQGEEVILNSAYRQVGRVHAGNGYKVDLHDFHIGPDSTAVFTVFNPIQCDLSALGGPHGGAVTDGAFQEIDLRTGLVRREWHGIDHVALSDSYATPVGTSTSWPFDFFHINSAVERPNGTTIVSARNTSAIYELNTASGRVLEEIGGRSSNVRLAPDAQTAYQHDARVLPNGTISVFDNGGVPMVHNQSRALIIEVNRRAGTGALVAQYEHPTPLSSGSQGNFQTLADGDAFVGWGSEPYFSEFSPGGQTLFDAHFRGPYQSYRGYRFAWQGAPADAPAIAAVRSASTGVVVAYASWNGDTRTARWRLLAGSAAGALAPVATSARSRFETAIVLPSPASYLAVEALDASGAVIGRSRTIRR
ncbi:MAG TPA: arylsulfotransferase family protein, partial [Gemmatimonadales bacterium]|nr:arylsulfotransferase family protein [Gemmatimonadales bacterium]